METQKILMRSLAIVVIVSAIWAVTDADYIKVKPVCCTSVSTVQVTDTIISVSIQRGNAPCVRAVIFETERGYFCSDPRQSWVRRKVQQFFRTVKTNQQTSTPATTSSISGQTNGEGSA
ncbi:C-C motif chemokine 24-like [Danio aesculapii]|uniref:C-C motif chemokine 24-like n=1 Tax=Danio aesculapii TaxID=1142201 RepID=UPI0024BFBA9C|nr:C-C motif chemokine 24-like [Danio aesculapii]